MTIEMWHRDDGVDCPKLFCDYCADPIEDLHDGIVAWTADNPIVAVTHKDCWLAFENQREQCGVYTPWATEELSWFFGYLAHNLGFDQEQWERDPGRQMMEG